MVTSSAPNTPLDPLDSEAVRVSVGSLAAVIINGNAAATESPLVGPRLRVKSLDSTSLLEAVAEHGTHSQPQTPHYEKRKSVASVRVPIHEIPTPQTPRSPQRQSSQVSSGAPTPPALQRTLSIPNLGASVSSLVPPEEALEEEAGPEPRSRTSPAVVLAEPATVEPEEVPLEPSRISVGHVDPFVVTSLPSMSPIPSAASLSPITTSPVPSTFNQSSKSTKRQSSDGTNGASQKSPASSHQSSVVENIDLSASVKFVKLKRTESAQGSSRMRKHLLHNSGKFWPPQRGKEEDMAEEKEKEGYEVERTPSIKSSKSRDVGVNNPAMSQESLASGHSSSATKAEKIAIEDWTIDAPRPLPFNAATSSHKRNLSDYHRPSLEDGTRGMVSMASAFDLGRSYPTSKSPDNAATSRWEPPHSPTRATAKDPVPVAPMSPSRPIGVGRVVHTRLSSSEAAARIEAHLNDVHTAKFKAKVGSQGQGRPDFLPMPTIAKLPRGSDTSTVRSVSPAVSASTEATEAEAGNHVIRPQPSLDQTPFATSRAAPPSRWSEENWRERQRTAGTLPLPTTTISFSASRTLPIGVSNSTSRGTLGSTEPSRAPSIFRPPTQNTINGRNRTLRM